MSGRALLVFVCCFASTLVVGCQSNPKTPTLNPDAGQDSGTTDGGTMDAMVDSSTPMVDSSVPMVDSSTPDATVGDAGTGVDLTGTWIGKISTTGTITAPTVGTQNVTITVVQRMVVTKTATGLTQELQICSLDTSGTAFSTVYPQAAIDTLHVSVNTSAPVVNIGDMVPVPSFVIYSGEDAQGNPVDSDGDGTPGIFVTAVAGGVLQLPSDIGIKITTNITGTLTDANTLTGMVSFGTTGTVYDISGVPPNGDASITVMTDQPTIPFTATRLPGDVPCSQVLPMFP